MQRLLNIRKPSVLFLNKTKRMIKSTSMSITITIFWFFKPLCTRRSLMTQFTNLDIERNLQYIFIWNKMLVIRKWSRRYTNKHTTAKQAVKVSNDVMVMLKFICWNYSIYRSHDIIVITISRYNFISVASSKSNYILDYEWTLQFCAAIK